jgi:hypothetical protein
VSGVDVNLRKKENGGSVRKIHKQTISSFIE